MSQKKVEFHANSSKSMVFAMLIHKTSRILIIC